MKKYITATLISLVMFSLTGFTQNITVSLTENKVCQLIFPEKIKKFRGGFNPDYFTLDPFDNILFIQCLAAFKDSNLSVITEDDSYYIFDIKYSDSNSFKSAYIFTEANRIYQRSSNAAQAEKQAIVKAQDTIAVRPSDIINKIVDDRGFILSNNGLKNKSMEIFLKGIYAHGNDLYFKIELTNSSQIPFTYNYIGFAAVSIKKGRVSSSDRFDISPTYSHVPSKSIRNGEKLSVIYKFNKFTVGKDRKLLIEIIEDNGERNFSFFITDKTILDAQAIN